MKGRFFVLRGLALKPALYDWGSEKLFGNECVSRFSRMEPVIPVGDVYEDNFRRYLAERSLG